MISDADYISCAIAIFGNHVCGPMPSRMMASSDGTLTEHVSFDIDSTFTKLESDHLLFYAKRAGYIWENLTDSVDPLGQILDAVFQQRIALPDTDVVGEHGLVRWAVRVIVDWFCSIFSNKPLRSDGDTRLFRFEHVAAAAQETAFYLPQDDVEFAAIDSIFDMARSTDEGVGDGNIVEECGSELALPECRNDSECSLLRQRFSQWQFKPEGKS
ncbi:hypothetical protein PWT90_05872 [Aphanocladium album]|nr:hypothetical protein PWT90_05872 [Aphanocladium album]